MNDTIKNAKSWELGTIRKKENGTTLIVFDKNVEITVGGRKVDLGDYNSLFLNDALENLEFLRDKDFISSDEYTKRSEIIATKGIRSVLKSKLL